MGLLDRFKRVEEPEAREIVPDRKVRAGQLLQLEGSILDVMDEMERLPYWRNPGWQAQVQEFYQVLTDARQLRPRSDFTWDELVDVAFEVRPVLRMSDPPQGTDKLIQLQERMMTIANALATPLPQEIQQ